MFLLACMSGAIAAAHAGTGRHPAATGTVRWATNYAEARTAALRLHRFLLLDLETDWCSWCRVMEADVYPAPRVAQELRTDYLCVKQNAESDPDGVTLQRRFGITTYPANIVVDPETGLYVTIDGYRNAPDFLADMEAATKQLSQLRDLSDRVAAQAANTEEREELAKAYADRRLYDEAAKMYQILLTDPTVNLPPDDLFSAAVCLASAGDNRNALAAINDLETNFPDSAPAPAAEALQGEILWHAGETAAARRVLEQWLEKFPTNPLADHVRAVLAETGQAH